MLVSHGCVLSNHSYCSQMLASTAAREARRKAFANELMSAVAKRLICLRWSDHYERLKALIPGQGSLAPGLPLADCGAEIFFTEPNALCIMKVRGKNHVWSTKTFMRSRTCQHIKDKHSSTSCNDGMHLLTHLARQISTSAGAEANWTPSKLSFGFNAFWWFALCRV